MSVQPGALITVEVEKPAAGGRMLARHEGQVVLVWGAIPGERVRARVDRVGRGVLFGETSEVLARSADRREAGSDWRCGGNVLAHVVYERQTQLKAEIIRDTLGRIGHVWLPSLPVVVPSPEHGYRMRARLHARGGRLGFLREGTHQLCDAGMTGQLMPETLAWLAEAERVIAQECLVGLSGVEVAENVRGDERGCHLHLAAGIDPAPFTRLVDGGQLTGLSAERADRVGVEQMAGALFVSDVVTTQAGGVPVTVRLRHSVRAFFQGNRFLLEPLVRHVVGLVPSGPVVDLYAGVGLFGLVLAAAGREAVTLVEGDPVSSADLVSNAEPFGSRVRVDRRSVETFLLEAGPSDASNVTKTWLAVDEATVIVDPPRTGMSKEALNCLVRAQPAHLVYVSCDIATLARDTRALLDGGYALDGVTGIDLFPNTAHVETVVSFTRNGSSRT
jgi:tRNA/tmRNA/rRNA uracil-C5-methylase (TrmA/RlmC/RlmD family)